MSKYTIEVTETLQKQIQIEAQDETEALVKAHHKYLNEEIVLDETTLVDYQMDIIKKQKIKEEVR